MNSHRGPRAILGGMLVLSALLLSFSSDRGADLAQAGEPKKKADKGAITPPPKDANYLSMEVNALRTLYLLRGTNPSRQIGWQVPAMRLVIIKKNYASCAEKKDRQREKADISDAYRKVLIELRAALIAEQENRIEELDQRLQGLQAAEEPVLDDHVKITDEARKKAGGFVTSLCTADQVVAYLASYGKDFPNPRSLLFAAMRVTKNSEGVTYDKKPSPEEWKKIRAFTIREVTWQVGGLNIDKGNQIAVNVGNLLDKAYAMSEADLKNNVDDLRAEVRELTGIIAPTVLLKHVIDQDMAELLSNPRLVPAVEARLKYLEAQENAKKKP